MSHPLSFQLHAQRAIVGWLLLYPALVEREEIADANPFCGTAFGGLERWLGDRCAGEIGNHENPTDLADFLAGLGEEFAAEAAARVKHQQAPVRQAFEALGDGVRQRAEGYRRSPGDPVAELDRWARAVAVAAYEGVGDRPIEAEIGPRIAGIDTSVIAAEGAPLHASAGWCAYACTRFPTGGGPAWRVELTLGVPTDQRSWHATGYLLLHEYVSHCAQGPWTGTCVQPGGEDLYAEGWMDVVAFLLHNVNLLGGSMPPPFDEEDADRRIKAAGAYHHDRCERRERGAAGRHRGARIAARFNRLLADGQEPVSEDFLRLSLQLNASAIGHGDRDRFVRGVEAAIEGEEAQLRWWIDAWRVSGAIEDLVEPVLLLYRARTEGRSVF